MARLRIGILYGGRSGEHEVSLASAAAVIRHLDPATYDPVPILVGKDGRWTLPTQPPTVIEAADVIQQARLKTGPAVPSDEPPARLSDPLALVEAPGGPHEPPLVRGLQLDVVFPLLHGPYGEDGTVQGLLELANVPYVGAGVLASAVSMDKAVMKVVFAASHLPQVDYRVFHRVEWVREAERLRAMIVTELGFPVFVKPANLGSSVGISKVNSADGLEPAINLAAEFDRKVVVEAAVPHAREIECAVLGNDRPVTSVPGEIVPSGEFYDYDAKYLDAGSELRIPAPLTPDQVAEIQRLAVAAFTAVDCSGMARIDFLVNGETEDVFVNEINTIPGFTTISMYAKLWAASGVDYADVLNRLVELALERHREKNALRTSIT